MDPRFSHIGGDLRFKPLKSKTQISTPADHRLKHLKQKSSLEGLKDPRGRVFDIRKLGLQNQRVPRTRVEFDTDSSDENDSSDDDAPTQNKSSDDEASENQNKSSDDEVSENQNKSSDEASESQNKLYSQQDSGYIDVEEDENLIAKMNKAIETPSSGMSERHLEQLSNPALDHARGVDAFSDEESSSDDEPSSDEEEPEYDWGELDKEAQWNVDGRDVEETSRIAVCNMDWDVYKSMEIMMLLKSFAEKGRVERVSVYMSQFGKDRIAEEQQHGPREVNDLPVVARPVKEDGETECTDHESVRKYHLNRMKEYYAVAECDSVDTARLVYCHLDRTALENGSVVDLRYIPSEMTFEESPESTCGDVVSKYTKAPGESSFTAANFVKPTLNWDDEDLGRRKALRNLADSADTVDQSELDKYLAPAESSDEDESSLVGAEEYTSVYERPAKCDTIELYRNLMATIGGGDASAKHAADDEEADKEEDFDSEDDSDEDDDEAKEGNNDGLTPFEKYLAKRKTKAKLRKKLKKEQAGVIVKKRKDDDLDIPDEVKDDPFFKKELAIRKRENLRIAEEQRLDEDKTLADQERAKIDREKDLALLMMDDDGEGAMSHVDMREAVRHAAATEANKGRKKVSRWKMAKIKAKEKRLAKHGVVTSTDTTAQQQQQQDNPALPTLHLTPSEVVNDERFAAILSDHKGALDPTHPEFKKHKTPFVDELGKEIRKKHLKSGPKPKKRKLE